VRQQDEHEGQGEWKAGQQLGRVSQRAQREKRGTVIAHTKSRLPVLEIECDTGSHHHRADEGREQQHNVKPDSATLGLDDPDCVWVLCFKGARKCGLGHTVAGLCLIRNEKHESEEKAGSQVRDVPGFISERFAGGTPALPSRSTAILCQA
jgi:hypothetical protein